MIKKVLLTDLVLISSQHFPYIRQVIKHRKHKVLLGIGGNVGDVIRRFEHLFQYLKTSPYVTLTETAPILKNPPFGYLEQDDFYNSLILIETNLTPRALLRYILRIEKKFGRKRLFKDGPRTMDIDIIFYENVKMDTKVLTIPHPEWMNRSSVLIPLSKMKNKF